MEQTTSHYIVLSSEVARGQQGSSLPSNFVTTLTSPLSLKQQNYELGLAEIYYSPLREPFGFNTDDDKITLVEYPYTESILSRKKDLDSDLKTFNNANSKEMVKITINRQDKCEVVNSFGRLTRAVLGETFRSIFGFESDNYQGTHFISERKVNRDMYNGLSDGEKLKITFFNPTRGQIEMFFKTASFLPVDVLSFNTNNQNAGVRVLMEYTTKNNQVYYRFQHSYGPRFGFRLDERLRLIFGFNFLEYESSNITAENPLNPKYYSSVPPGTKLPLCVYEILPKTTVKICEVMEDTPEGFVTAVNESFMLNGITSSHLMASGRVIEYKSTGPIHSLILSKRIMGILGTSETQLFPGFKTDSFDLFFDNKMIIVTTDVTAPQLLYASRENLIRILPHYRRAEDEHVVFQPVYYSPVVGNNITSVRIQLRNEQHEIIPFKRNITVVLHVRPISL